MEFMLLFGVATIFVLIVLFRDANRYADKAEETVDAPRRQTRTVTQRENYHRFDESNGYLRAKVECVIDGDTVIVSRSFRKIKIRLDSIDCPENGQHWGDIAKFGLIKLIGGRRVYLQEHGEDRYGRTVASIFVQQGSKWINVNERMVTLGHAWVMRRYYDHLSKERQDTLNRLERWAKTRKVGLWKTPNPIPPWRWRNGETVIRSE